MFLGFGIEGVWRAPGLDYVAFVLIWVVSLIALYQARTFVRAFVRKL
ncbi:hypothetical protein [Methermicoccus shengliensis]|uniref:Uncharacterized protein n=1 Tax=Methermicoccus shengliensis TaxID=660064 RepID=A0A832RWD8_9EURY|nr:hypothetical protein [Methermicoccus shengliensis]KUK04064.1 MAG: hypothetical protein XD46_1231 [Euryarchaeota archaeon 55_53]HIH69915.1 hypothetical protein [Methermicoccus shengliensis]